jgi:Bacterial sugar transferase
MGNFLLGLFGNLLAAEIGAWCRGLAGQIVCATARKLPEKLQPRMLEEWSALLEDIPGDLSKLWMAISLYRKRSVLADECEKLRDDVSLTKRFVDILVSASGLLLLLRLFLLVALLIKIESPGPVFYRQARVGLRGRPFSMWKFRSMAQTDNPQISRIGWLLRETRIDEFPQLINVLKGEMSLVGPRPQ